MTGTQDIHNHDHPIWGLLRFLILMIGASFMLWISATEFDSTELKSIFGIGGLAAALEFWRSRQAHKDEKT